MAQPDFSETIGVKINQFPKVGTVAHVPCFKSDIEVNQVGGKRVESNYLRIPINVHQTMSQLSPTGEMQPVKPMYVIPDKVDVSAKADVPCHTMVVLTSKEKPAEVISHRTDDKIVYSSHPYFTQYDHPQTSTLHSDVNGVISGSLSLSVKMDPEFENMHRIVGGRPYEVPQPPRASKKYTKLDPESCPVSKFLISQHPSILGTSMDKAIKKNPDDGSCKVLTSVFSTAHDMYSSAHADYHNFMNSQPELVITSADPTMPLGNVSFNLKCNVPKTSGDLRLMPGIDKVSDGVATIFLNHTVLPVDPASIDKRVDKEREHLTGVYDIHIKSNPKTQAVITGNQARVMKHNHKHKHSDDEESKSTDEDESSEDDEDSD